MTDSKLIIAQRDQPRAATPPRRPLPPGACDCHVHISDATGKFPIRRQTHPPLHAPFEVHHAMVQAAGLERSVAVQLMAYGGDNDAMTEALLKSGGAMRGIAELTAAATDADLERLHAAGVRGLRFYFELPTSIPGLGKIQGIGMDDLVALAPRMRALNWVAEVSARCDLIVERAPQLQSLGVPIVLEHMAGCTAARGAADPGVQRMLGLLGTGSFWVKLTICRMSNRYPDFEDLRPLHDAFVAAAPDRMVWGSDWPHGMMHDNAPDVGHLLDLFDTWIEHDDRLRQTILAENPARLFDF
jgi:predicted TIM-barrel fold metal-dependent hydrolase